MKPNPEPSTSQAGSSTNVSQAESTASQSTTTAPTPSASQELPTDTTHHSRTSTANGSIPASSKSDLSTVSKSWYGSWRSKTTPIAQVAKESIGVTGGSTTELSSNDSKQAAPNSPRQLLSKRRSSKGDPIAASMTKLHVTSNNNESRTEVAAEEPKPQKEVVPEAPLPPDPVTVQEAEDAAKKDEKDNKAEAPPPTPGMTSWRYWWSRPDGYTGNPVKSEEEQAMDTTLQEAQKTPLPGQTPLDEPQKTLDAPEPAAQLDGVQEQKTTPAAVPEGGPQGKSWFWLWSKAQNALAQGPQQQEMAQKPPEVAQENQPKPVEGAPAQPKAPDGAPAQLNEPPANETAPQQPADAKAPTAQEEPPKSSSWAFWSKSTPRQASDKIPSGTTHKEVGELAVADTPSQSNPEVAQFNEQEAPAQKEPTQKDPALKEPPKTRGRSRGKDTATQPSTPARPSTPATPATPAGSVKDVALLSPAPKQAEASTSKQPEPSKVQQPPNLLLPDFRSTYNLVQTPSFWKQLRKYLLGGEPEAPHLFIEPSPPRIKKALAIGVHGYFPGPLIQKVIGQPTGTSIRFANNAAAAIDDWAKAHGYSCEIEKVALEGEGFIADRVSTLWKLMLNWIEHIKQADFILVACHSQGVPVAVQLIAKLIHFGCINPAAKIGICAMAGINLGPFIEYKPRFFGGQAGELFDFAKPDSTVSKNYMGALEEILKHGVKVVYVGSIDDQLVSLESSIFSNVSHPYLYRAVFVDGRIHAPDL
jgi:hypothetical protein